MMYNIQIIDEIISSPRIILRILAFRSDDDKIYVFVKCTDHRHFPENIVIIISKNH